MMTQTCRRCAKSSSELIQARESVKRSISFTASEMLVTYPTTGEIGTIASADRGKDKRFG
jgi:hypothetical protein